MLIIFHRKSQCDMYNLYYEFSKKLIDCCVGGPGFKQARGYVIYIEQDIKIDFRTGHTDYLAGLRPDYYNADTYAANQYLEQSASKCSGQYASVEDILSMIEGIVRVNSVWGTCKNALLGSAKTCKNALLKSAKRPLTEYEIEYCRNDVIATEALWESFQKTKKCEGTMSVDIKNAIKKVIFSGPATIVLWNDGTKTMVKLCTNEINLQDAMYEDLRWTGLALCISKKVMGNTGNYKKIFEQWC